MKILRVANIDLKPSGGMAKVMVRTTEILRDQGYIVDILGSDDLLTGTNSFYRNYILPFRIGKIIANHIAKRGAYDVVEIHEPLSYGLLNQIKKIDRNKRPALVIMSHGVEERGRKVVALYDQSQSFLKNINSKIREILINRAFRFADAVMCLNSQDLNFLISKGINNAHLIRNGVDKSLIEVGKILNKTNKVKNILFLGTWLRRKGCHLLSGAITNLFKKFDGITLTIAGSGCENNLILDNFMEEHHGRIKIIQKFEGNNDLISIISECDVFVLPSIFEGFPLSMLEAAALKKLLIVADNSGMADFIKNRVNGLLFPTNDIKGFTNTLFDCLAFPGKYLNLPDEAYKSVQDYTWDNATKDLITVYDLACLKKQY
jgi:glycosyltransferase involved in cell wall biosynthesis